MSKEALNIFVRPDALTDGEWRVEIGPNVDGVIDVAIFSGPNAEDLAWEYADWKEAGGATQAEPLAQ